MAISRSKAVAPAPSKVEVGDDYVRSLDLSPEAKAVLRANLVQRKVYPCPKGGLRSAVKSSEFWLVPEVERVLRVPLSE